MRRRGLLVGAWAVATLAATLVAWGAVRQVTEEVSPRAALPLPDAAVVVAQAEATDRPSPSPPPVEAGPTPSAEPEPPGATEAYRLQGGVVTVRYRGGATTLAGATPNSGFVVEVHDNGPEKVDVRFESDDHESRLVTRVKDGQPEPEREERAR